MKKTLFAHGPSSVLCGVVLTMSALVPAASFETPSALCPTPKGALDIAKMKEDLHTKVMDARRSNVLVGVDVLGRVAIAVDTDQDDLAERILMFTGQDRLKGPWSRLLKDASVTIQRGTFLVTSRQDSFGMSLAVSVADLPALPRWATDNFRQDNGRELVQLFDELGAVTLTGLDHNSIQSWPEALWTDLLASSSRATPNGCEVLA